MNKALVKKAIQQRANYLVNDLKFKQEENGFIYRDEFKSISFLPDIVTLATTRIDFYSSIIVNRLVDTLNKINQNRVDSINYVYSFRYVLLVDLGEISSNNIAINDITEMDKKLDTMFSYYLEKEFPILVELDNYIKLTSFLENQIFLRFSKSYNLGMPESLMLLKRVLFNDQFELTLKNIYSIYPFLSSNKNFQGIITGLKATPQSELYEMLQYSNTYIEFNADSVIKERSHLNLTSVKTITGFDDDGEPRIVENIDGTLSIIFNFMPPLNGTDEEVDDSIFENFDEVIAKAIDSEVIWEDREHFLIPAPKTDTIQRLIHFLNNFWKDHTKGKL